MGAQDLARGRTTEQKQVKVGRLKAEIVIAQPPALKIIREEDLPSPFDSMYIFPRVDIKTETPVVNIYGEIEPKDVRKKRRQEV